MTSNELWICVDCRELIETGESTAHAESAKPLSRLTEGTNLVFAGSDRADGGFNDFSNDDCPGCGSRLAGVRFIYVAA
jgi:hypothetical protein